MVLSFKVSIVLSWLIKQLCHVSCLHRKRICLLLQLIFFLFLELTTAWKSLAQSKAAVSTPTTVFCWINEYIIYQPFRKSNEIDSAISNDNLFNFIWHLSALFLVAAHRKLYRGNSRVIGSPGLCHGPPQEEILQNSPLQGWVIPKCKAKTHYD